MSDVSIATSAAAVFRGSLAQNATRTLLSVVAIALGVALGYAVQLINAAAINELAQGVQTLSGDADLDVRGPRSGFAESIYPQLARLPGVAAASPVVEVDAKLAHRPEALHVLGIDVFRAAYLQPGLVPASDDRFGMLRPDRIYLSPAAARWLDAAVDRELVFQVGLADVSLRVSGLLAATSPQRYAVMDIAAAQERFGRLGRIDRVDLRLQPGTDVDAFRARVQATLPPGLRIDRPAATIAAAAGLSRSYRVNLDVLALVALFTGGLLVFSTQALAVVRRRAQFALLRVLGITRRQLVLLILAESALIGALGSVLGLGAGFGLAQIAVRFVGGDLGSGYFRGTVPVLVPEPLALALFFALGVTIALAGSFSPALEAARAAPAPALKSGDEQRSFEGVRAKGPGLALLVLGTAATLLPPVRGLPLFGYASIALLLIGTLMLLPRLVAPMLALVSDSRHAAIRLAIAQLRGAPAQVALSLAAIVASVSLMVSMAIMVSSFRQSLEHWLTQILPADLYVRASGGDTAFLPPEAQARIAALPGIRRVEFLREQQLLLDSSAPRVVLQARAVDAANPGGRLPLEGDAIAVAPGAPPPIWVNGAVADLYGFTPGKEVELPLAGRRIAFTVAGVFRDYARQQGAIVIDRARFIALTGDRRATNAAIWLDGGTSPAMLRSAIEAAVAGGDKLEFALPGEIRAVSLHIFDRSFALTYALEAAAVIIGLVGLSSSFGALVLARRREFGVLRHLGMTRRQIAAMLAVEGAAVSALGLLVGCTLGAAMSLVLIRVVNRQSFHWSMDLAVPWFALAQFALAMLVLACAAVAASGRQVMSGDAVRAVKDDW